MPFYGRRVVATPEVGLNVDGAVFVGFGNLGCDADDLVAQVDVFPDVLAQERELAELADGNCGRMPAKRASAKYGT